MPTKILSRGARKHLHQAPDDAEPDRNAQEPSASSLQLPRAILVAVLAAAVVSLVLLAFSWPTVTSDPKDLPIAAVGDDEQIDQIAQNAPRRHARPQARRLPRRCRSAHRGA